MIDVARIREEFPILSRQVNGKPLVYLDTAATAQKPRRVIDAITRFYEETNSNVHRGVHLLAEEATVAYESARDRVARFIGAPASRNVIWTRGTTEAANLVAYSWARRNLKPDDEILVTLMEHHSNLVPWQLAAADTGAKIRAVPIRDDFTLDMEEFHRLLTPRTRLVAVIHLSNVLGTVNPVKEITEAAHRVGARVFVDAAQSVPNMPVDVVELGSDFLAFSGHKMLGPSGIGVLYGTDEALESLAPFHGGGEMITEVRLESSEYKEIPYRFEAGTPPIAGAVGLGAAVDYLTELGMENVRVYEEDLARYAVGLLEAIEGVKVHGPAGPRGGAVSFEVDGIHPHDLATILDSEGVAIRAGHHCTQLLMRWLDVSATARASFYIYNLREEADHLAEAIRKAQNLFDTAGRTA